MTLDLNTELLQKPKHREFNKPFTVLQNKHDAYIHVKAL